jgi:hypothetical protein
VEVVEGAVDEAIKGALCTPKAIDPSQVEGRRVRGEGASTKTEKPE